MSVLHPLISASCASPNIKRSDWKFSKLYVWKSKTYVWKLRNTWNFLFYTFNRRVKKCSDYQFSKLYVWKSNKYVSKSEIFYTYFTFNRRVKNPETIRVTCGCRAALTLTNWKKVGSALFGTLYHYEYKMSIKKIFHHWTSKVSASVHS